MNMIKYMIITGLIIVSAINAFGQGRKINGKVLDEATSEPLPGAFVKADGTALTTETDKNGSFNLSVPPGKVKLSVSYVGYVTGQVEFNSTTDEPLVLRLTRQALTFEEVVVSTGYQDIPRERATGSFTKVDSHMFNQQVGTTVLPRLEAVANAVSTDRTTTGGGIMVRGLSTIQGVRGPLIVLDNFPYEGTLDNINPNEIESVTILKDAAAASIWGTRAGNGVIVITTKKGKYNRPLTVDFNANLTLGGKPDLTYLQEMTPKDYVAAERYLFSKGAYDAQINSVSKPALSPVVELLLAVRRGTLSQADADARIAEMETYDRRDDMRDLLYRQAVNQQYNLSLSGGGANTSWLTSAGVDRNTGNLSESYQRINLRSQYNIRLFERLTLNTDLYLTNSRSAGGRPGYGDISYGNYPYARIADTEGNALPVAREYSLSYLATAGGGKLQDWKNYPLTDWRSDRAISRVQDMLVNTGLRYRVANGLNADIKYQYERQVTQNEQAHAAESYFARSLVNRFTQIDAAGNISYKVPPGGIYDTGNRTLSAHSLRGSLSLDKSWSKSSINAIAGAELRDAATRNYQYRRYGVAADVLTSANVDYTTAFPTYVTKAVEFIPSNDSFGALNSRFVSLFTNLAYLYDRKYGLSVSGRRDASNLFGVNTNDRWTPLWSAGGSWNVSNESFYHFAPVPEVKLRATYGFSGNVDQSKSAVTIISLLGNSVYSGTPLGRIERYANPELKWERVATLNFGIDFAMKNNRVRGSVEYYRKKGMDLFGTAMIDYTTGIGSSATKNVAAMSARGLDIELNTINIKGRLEWTSNLNLSFYSDRIDRYYVPNQQASSFVGSSSTKTVTGMEGKPVYAIFSYRFAGLDPQTGDPLGYVNGQKSKDYTALTGASATISDLAYAGPALPTCFGSFGNTVTYRSFSLTARLLYKFGHYFRRPTISYTAFAGGGSGHADYTARWQMPGDELRTHIPSFVYPTTTSRDAFFTGSDINVEKGDNFRLQYVTLNYEVPVTLVRQLHFQKLSAYLNANNLGIIWKANKSGLDPDFPLGGFPPVRTIAFGIRGTF